MIGLFDENKASELNTLRLFRFYPLISTFYVSLIAENYINGVLEGTIPAGPYIIKAFQRHKRDLLTGAERGLHFDPVSGDRVIEFVETFCKQPDADSYMELMPWQQALIYIAYGWKRADGTRRFRRVYCEIAKKNGKTGLAACLSLYHLVADNELSPRVFIAATTAQQARKCFDPTVAIRDASPDLSLAVHKHGDKKPIALSMDNLGRISMMTGRADSEDGAIISFAVLDELHRWKQGTTLYSVIRYGGRTRKQPLMFEITTAGSSANDTSFCWQEREYGTKVLDGDPSVTQEAADEFCPFIFSLDLKDDWKDEKNWVKANPSLGYILKLDDIRNEFGEVEGKPTELGDFKRFALNIWSQQSDEPAIDIDKWVACRTEPNTPNADPKRLRKELIDKLTGRLCFGGLDLAPKNDTTAFVLLFPPLEIGEPWYVLEWFWLPNYDIPDRIKRDQSPYDMWAKQGFLTLTSGDPADVTDVNAVADTIIELGQKFDIKQVFYDPAWSFELVRKLADKAPAMYEKFLDFKQNYIRMNGPCIEFMRKVMRAEFAHANNPIMRVQMRNLRWAHQRNTDFIMPARNRNKKSEKIDGCAALIMALACATSPDNIIKPKKDFWVKTVDVSNAAEKTDLERFLQKQYPGVTFD